jgi:multiple sugar transport system permease protein
MFSPVAIVGLLYNLWRNISLYDTWPGLIIPYMAAILVFIFAWNDFLFAFALTSTKSGRTMPAAIALFPGASQFSQPTGSIAAAAMVVTVPIIIMVLSFQRRIVAGLTAGAVKG